MLALKHADVIIGLNSDDEYCVKQVISSHCAYEFIKPFMGPDAALSCGKKRGSHREEICRELSIPENEILLPNALVLSLDPTPKPNESFDGAKIDPAGRRIEDDDEDCSNEFGSAIFFYFDTSFVIKSDVKILKCPENTTQIPQQIPENPRKCQKIRENS